MSQFSLYARLLRMTAVPLVCGLMMIGVYSYLTARNEAESIYDAQLAHFAQVIGLLAQHEVEAGNTASKIIRMQHGEFAIPYEKDFAYRVWLGSSLLMQSENAVHFGKKTAETGFTDKVIHHLRWRFYVLHDHGLTVEVAEDYHIRRDLVKQVGLSILLPLLLLFPVLVVAVWFGVRRGLKPLHNLSDMIRVQTPESLNPVQLDITPTEVIPLIYAINHLMTQVEEAIDREKRFTRYAAHEMRTPLAALKTQIQVALREKDEVLRKELLQDVLAGVDRATHLLEQLLILARAQQQEIHMQQVNVSTIANEITNAFIPLAKSKNQQLLAQISQNVFCVGNPELVSILIRNAIDNACKYSSDGAVITLHLEAGEGGHGFKFTISNPPAHLSEEQAKQIFEPFYRASDADIQGVGLGLAIVSWIAKTHQFKINHSFINNYFTLDIVSSTYSSSLNL